MNPKRSNESSRPIIVIYIPALRYFLETMPAAKNIADIKTFFSCHIAFHVSEGLYINILEQPQNITQPQIPAILQETCDGWNAYSSNNTVDQLDSGLRKNRLKLRN